MIEEPKIEFEAPKTDQGADNAATATATNGQSDKQRTISTIEFPYGDLDDAITVSKAVDALGGNPDLHQLSTKLDYNSVDNGAFKGKISTARKFGLVITTGANAASNANLTDLGRRILQDDSSAQAKVEAFLNVQLFKRVYDQYRGQLLPPDDGLENFIAQVGVSSKQKDKARSSLQRSAQTAGFFAAGRSKLVMPIVSQIPVSVHSGAVDSSDNSDIVMLTSRIDQLEKENERLRQNGNLYLPSELPQAIIGVLTTLPLTDDDRWTADDLKEWTAMFETVVKRAFRHRISAPIASVPPSVQSPPAAQA